MTFLKRSGKQLRFPGSLGIRAEPRLSLRAGSFRSRHRDKIKTEREIFLLSCSLIILLWTGSRKLDRGRDGCRSPNVKLRYGITLNT